MNSCSYFHAKDVHYGINAQDENGYTQLMQDIMQGMSGSWRRRRISSDRTVFCHYIP